MDVRSVWSGGSQWTTETHDRLDGEWMDNGETPVNAGLTGQPFPDVAIGAAYLTDQLMSASWSLGISGFLADLAPNTASFSFVGQVTAVPGDDVVVTTGWGVQWSGRVDTVTQMRDAAGDWWTTITATDRLGALGVAELNDHAFVFGNLEEIAEDAAATAGVDLDIVDDSVGGLIDFEDVFDVADPYTGTLLAYLSPLALSSNAMLAMARDGRIHAVVREDISITINGEFETNVAGWTDFNSATIARSTSSPYAGTACARISASTTAYSGDYYPLGSRIFRKGVPYRLQFAAQKISGTSDTWYADWYSDSVSTGTSTTFTATGTWTLVTLDWTPDADYSDIGIGIYHPDASVAVLAIDSVTVGYATFALTGIDAPASWTLSTSIDVNVNRWVILRGAVLTVSVDADDIKTYGERTLNGRGFDMSNVADPPFDDWTTYGGSQRPTASGQLIVSSWAQDDLILLDPFQWVTESGTAWQVMSVTHDVTPSSWTVSITADNLLDLL